jgi:hypothetical protein
MNVDATNVMVFSAGLGMYGSVGCSVCSRCTTGVLSHSHVSCTVTAKRASRYSVQIGCQMMYNATPANIYLRRTGDSQVAGDEPGAGTVEQKLLDATS